MSWLLAPPRGPLWVGSRLRRRQSLLRLDEGRDRLNPQPVADIEQGYQPQDNSRFYCLFS